MQIYYCYNRREILRRRLKLDGTPENVPLYPFEIPGRLSELNLLDYSAQVVEEASVDDLDPNERVRLRNVIKYRKGESALTDLSDEELVVRKLIGYTN